MFIIYVNRLLRDTNKRSKTQLDADLYEQKLILLVIYVAFDFKHD